MRFLSLFWFLSTAIPFISIAAIQDLSDPAWPASPVPINTTEAVIEAFWAPKIKAEKRWNLTPLSDIEKPAPLPTFNRRWDCVEIKWDTTQSIKGTRIERTFDLPLLDYERLVLRLNLSPDCLASLSAKIDGQWQHLETPTPGAFSAIEVVQGISGVTLQGVRIDVSSTKPGTQTARLRWLMLQKPGVPWTPPSIDFTKFVTPALASPQPGLELLFDHTELERMRNLYLSSIFDDVRAADTELAQSRMSIAPLSNLRPYLLYGRESIRLRDQQYHRDVDGLLLAIHGLLNQDEAALIQAAKHAIVLAHMDHWADGFMDRFPGSTWTHSGFAPNVGTIIASLLLDWCWDVLSPAGRELIREAIRTKGLPYLESQKLAMANQGVRFHKGLILGKIACNVLNDPKLKDVIAADLARMNRQLSPLIRTDGTFAEELGYGLSTLASTLVTYQAAAKYLEKPLIDVVNPRILNGLNFALLQQHTLSAPLAAFAAGPLQEQRMVSLCAPSSILDASGFSNREMTVFGLDWLWAPHFPAKRVSPILPRFSVHSDGGWVFAGSAQSEVPRLGFESGFWDEEGHNYKRKNALTLDADGETLLLTRHHVAYADKRHPLTSATTAFNTFAPGGRNQEPVLAKASLNQSLLPGFKTTTPRGADLLTATDLGHTVVLESDAATAWSHNVTQCQRRVLFLRPGVILIEDTALLETPETGVQTWNSLFPWEKTGPSRAFITTAKSVLELQVITPLAQPVFTKENSVHRIRKPAAIVPVHATTVTLPANTKHRVITLLTHHPIEGSPPSIKIIGNDSTSPTSLQVQQDNITWTIYFSSQELIQIDGLQTDGSWGFITSESGNPSECGVFSATQLTWHDQEIQGNGFLSISRAENP